MSLATLHAGAPSPAGHPRAVNTVSLAEMQRRWRRVREEMRRLDLDALVVQNSSDWVGGYVRWFSNQPAHNGYPTTLVFPRDAAMSLIEQGPFGGGSVASDAEAEATGVARRLTTPSYASVHYTGAYDARIALSELQRLGARRVGLVAPGAWYHGFGEALLGGLCTRATGLTGAMTAGCGADGPVDEVVDFTDAVDRLKAIKSDEERACIRRVAAMQDEVMARMATFIRPGLKDYEVAAHAQFLGQQMGSEQGVFLCSSAPPGQAASFRGRSLQGRTLRPGDVFSLLVENNGDGGYYTELSRIFVLGRAPEELREAHDAVLEAQRYALSLLIPGTPCAAVHERHNAWLRERGLPEEHRLSIHGMGYDMVERPLVRGDESMSIEQHMAIVVHPGVLTSRVFAHNTEVYLIEAHGPGECLHRTPRAIVELD